MRRPAVIFLLILSALLPARGGETDVLLGRIRPEILMELGEPWRAVRAAYEPADDDLRAIGSLPFPAVLDVYLGTWCPDSLREVPRFLKILDRAAPRTLKVRLYGIDRTKEKPARLVRRAGLERVPTFILSVAGREIGRIVESPDTTLEHDLALLIARAAGPPNGPGEVR